MQKSTYAKSCGTDYLHEFGTVCIYINLYYAVLQVTEEDIALCMGEIPNFLPEEDEQSNEEHPLRILSQENLTVVSTFTGMGEHSC